MARLAWGESSSAANPVLDLFIRDASGSATDPAALEYAILDFTTGTEVQVSPVSGYTPVTIAAPPTGERLSLGRFFAPWTVVSGSNVGTYRIRWRATDAADVVHTLALDFEVVAVSVPAVVTSGVRAADFAAFGLDVHATETATRVRRTGAHSGGTWVVTSTGNTTMACSCQPAPGRDLEKLDEADRSRGALKFITRTPLRTADEGGVLADLITYDGSDYEVKHAEAWPPGSIGVFSKAIAVRVET